MPRTPPCRVPPLRRAPLYILSADDSEQSESSTESQRNRPNRRQTKCTEHASEKIRPSKRLERYIVLSFARFPKRSWDSGKLSELRFTT